MSFQSEGVEISTFPLRDIASGSDIVYQHDDTETTDDVFEVTVSDSVHQVARVIPITVTPVDDETPRMTINNGIDVEISETKTIGNNALKVSTFIHSGLCRYFAAFVVV